MVMVAWDTVKWVMSPLGKLLAIIGTVLIFFIAVFANGRRSGREAERKRVDKVVKKVEKKMREKTDRNSSTEQTRERLNKGNF
jgi:hypothetical protein